MKTSNLKYIAAGMLVACAGTAIAQNTYSGYFADGYEYRFRMNPAIGNDSESFVSIPVVGNINVAMQGNLHVRDLFYNVDGKTVLFTNPAISASKAMKGFSDNNKLGTSLNLSVMAAGFKAWGGYNTISINARARANMMVPKDLFSLMKEDITNKTYNIKDFRVNASSFAEIALGHSRNINENWRVGGTLKFLIGIADFDARLNSARLSLNADQGWQVQSNAEVHGCINGLSYKTRTNAEGQEYVDGIKMDGFGLNGFGLALDLGAVYTLNQDWQFSASVLDFGFISWSKDAYASTNGTKTFNTDDCIFDLDDDNTFDQLTDGLEKIFQLEPSDKKGGRTTMPAATINLAARYTLPVYRPLTFGLMNTTCINGPFTWTDFRLSANVAPVKMFSASANLAVGTYGVGFGWLLNYHYTGFGLFIGMDHTLGKLAKQGIPLNSNASLNFGMNILF